jgi:subtilisin family serine protease
MKKRISLHKILFLSVLILSFGSTLIGGSVQALAPDKLSPQVQQALESSQAGELQSVIVTLKAQANLANILDRNRRVRISRVIRALQNMADATQNRIRALLQTRQADGKVAEVEYFWVFNGLAVTATADVIEELAALPEVRSITPDSTLLAPAGQAALAPAEANLDIVNAPALWQMGYQGQGIVVANMDTGVDLNHPDLINKWRGGTNSWFDPNGQHSTTPTDYNGHGTWTMGVMVGGDGGGSTVGVAPDAQWIAVKIFDDQGSATTAGIHAGFQWLLDPDGDPNTDDAPHVVNNSWTFQSPGCDLEFELAGLRCGEQRTVC